MANRNEWQQAAKEIMEAMRARLGPPPSEEEWRRFYSGAVDDTSEWAERMREMAAAYDEEARAFIWNAALDTWVKDERKRIGGPPSVEKIMAFRNRELTIEREGRVLALLVYYPSLTRFIDKDDVSAEEITAAVEEAKRSDSE